MPKGKMDEAAVERIRKKRGEDVSRGPPRPQNRRLRRRRRRRRLLRSTLTAKIGRVLQASQGVPKREEGREGQEEGQEGREEGRRREPE